jgi:hypothetical protein
VAVDQLNNSVVGLMLKTYPFLFIRLVVNLAAIYPAYLCVVGAIKYGREITGTVFILSDILFGWLGLTVFVFYLEFVRRYIVHIIRYAQLAAVTQLITEGEIKGSVTAYGFRKMLDKFGSVSIMFLVDKVMNRAVSQISRWIVEEGNFIPSFLKKGILARFLSSIVRTLVFHIDEVIISYMYKHSEEDLWDSVGKGISLYVKSWKSILKAAFFSILWMKIFSILTRGTILIYGVWLFYGYGVQALFIFFLFYKALMSFLKATFVEPYTSISMVVGFYESNPQEDGLANVTDKLKEISDEFKSIILRGRGDKRSLGDKIAEEFTGNLSSDGSSVLDDLQRLVEGKKGSVEE